MRKIYFFAVTALATVVAFSSSFFVQAGVGKTDNQCSKNVISVNKSDLAEQLEKLLPSVETCWKNGKLNNCMTILIEYMNKSCTNKPATGTPGINKPETGEMETTKPNINIPETGEMETTKPNINKPETGEIETTKPNINIPETEKPSVNVPETTTGKGQENQNLTYAEQVVELVNKERAKAGLGKVTLDKNIEKAAMARAKEIQVSFSHTRPNGSSFSSVLKEYGINYRGCGENIAWGQSSPEVVMNGWMNSEGHRANILNSNFTKIGVGYYQNASGRKYWTQLFVY